MIRIGVAQGLWEGGKSLAEDAAENPFSLIVPPEIKLEEAASVSGLLRGAKLGKGNFGLGRAMLREVELAGKAWVGEGATLASDGKTLVSADGLRQYRPATFKPKLGRHQANLESRRVPEGEWQSNGHIDIQQ